MKKLKSPHFIF